MEVEIGMDLGVIGSPVLYAFEGEVGEVVPDLVLCVVGLFSILEVFTEGDEILVENVLFPVYRGGVENFFYVVEHEEEGLVCDQCVPFYLEGVG